MPEANKFKTPCQRLRKSSLEQQTTAAQQYHLQIDMLARVLVPFSLDHLAPIVNLLDFINHKQAFSLSTECHGGSCPFPYSAYPVAVLRIDGICHFYRIWNGYVLQHLPYES